MTNFDKLQSEFTKKYKFPNDLLQDIKNCLKEPVLIEKTVSISKKKTKGIRSVIIFKEMLKYLPTCVLLFKAVNTEFKRLKEKCGKGMGCHFYYKIVT